MALPSRSGEIAELSYADVMRGLHSCFLLPALLSVAWACQAPVYIIDGDGRRPAQPSFVGMEQDVRVLTDARAGSRPVIRVEPENVLGHRSRQVVVTSHGPDAEPGLFRIMAKMNGGHVSVVYAPPGGIQLPVEVGDELFLRHIPPDPESPFRGDALIIRDIQNRVLVAYSAGGGLPTGLFGERLGFSPSRRLAYTEVVTLESMCLAMLEHNRLRVQYEGTFHHIAPGTTVTLPYAEQTYRLVVIDVAEPVPGRCDGEVPSELSFALIAQR